MGDARGMIYINQSAPPERQWVRLPS
jgi:hypothetical protein